MEEKWDRFKTGFVEAAVKACGQKKLKEKIQENTLVDKQNRISSKEKK
jgi:hypothetical protein